jgi:hypothetical protein
MRRPKLLHPVTDDMRRELDIRVLVRAGAFIRPMRFPFMRVEVPARDHIRLFPLGRSVPAGTDRVVTAVTTRRPVQVIRVTWAQMTFGMKPYFVCRRCNKRRVYLYFDTLQAYCRCCADLRFLSQRKRARTRLLFRSHRIRVSLGDQHGKPGEKFPARPYLQTHRRYRTIIAKLRTIEGKYMNIIMHDRRRLDRERDEYGRFVRCDDSAADSATDDYGR